MTGRSIESPGGRLAAVAALLALAACDQQNPPPAPMAAASLEPMPGDPIALGSFASVEEARAAWRARNPSPGQIGAGDVRGARFRIDATGQIVVRAQPTRSGPPLRPPKPPRQ